MGRVIFFLWWKQSFSASIFSIVSAFYYMARNRHISILFIIHMDNLCCLHASSFNKTSWDRHSWEEKSIFIFPSKIQLLRNGACHLKRWKLVRFRVSLWLCGSASRVILNFRKKNLKMDKSAAHTSGGLRNQVFFIILFFHKRIFLPLCHIRHSPYLRS